MAGREELDRRLEALVEPVVTRMGYALVDVRCLGPSARPRVRITIDSPGGITLDDCERVSRRVEAALDADGLVGDDYVLEVESPGLGRVLEREREFRHFAGRAVEVTVRVPVEGRRRLVGTLLGLEGDAVVVELEGRRTTIPRAQVARVRLHDPI